MATATAMATVIGMVRMTSMKPHSLSVLTLSFLTSAAMAQTPPGAITNFTGTLSNTGATTQNFGLGTSDNKEALTLGRTWNIKPRISLTETLTDNVAIDGRTGNKEADLITQISPGVHIEGKSARLRAYLDYTLNAQIYSKSDTSRTRNSLNSFATLEALENWLYLDANARIAQQSISAFGTQSPGITSINTNATETATVGFSPYIRGQFGGLVDYGLRYNRSSTRSDASAVSDIDLAELSGYLKGNTFFRELQWSADASNQTVDYSGGRKTEASRATGRLTYLLTPQFRIIGAGGWEENNYASIDKQRHSTHGYGLDWNPTERTQFSAFKERRFFGDGHNVSFSHRFPNSSIRFTDTRDVSVLPNQFANPGYGTLYDVIAAQFAALPEPARTTAVQNFFNANPTISPNTQAVSGFLNARATVQRRQQLSLVVTGVRNTITLLANRNLSQSMFASNVLADDFSRVSEIQQQGFSISYSHQLSPLSSFNTLFSRQENTGRGVETLKTTTNLYQFNFLTKLGAKTSASLSIRHMESDGTLSYKENALIGAITYTY